MNKTNFIPKVILLTGASSGIGHSTALKLLSGGHVVYAAARRLDRMADLEAAGAHLIEMDVCSEASMAAGVERVYAEQGRVDVLINNAGYGYFGALETVSMEEARRQVEVNLFGLANLCRLVLPHMREAGGGRIINVASMAGHFCEPRGDWYHATKYAVVGLSQCLRMELIPFGIKVILIEPGAIATPWCDIAMDNIEACSKGTAYEAGARRHARLFRWAYAHFASSPERVSDAMVKASLRRRPRLRYRMGFGARAFPFFAKLLPGRCFDRMMHRIFG